MAKNAAVSDLMTNLSFTNAQMGETLAWVEDNNSSYDEGAVHFLTTYKQAGARVDQKDIRQDLSSNDPGACVAGLNG